MVKGTSRQVIVVPSPDPKLFEQAIFILREDALGRQGLSDQAILRQARLAADGYLEKGRVRKSPFSGAVCAMGGAAAMGLVWLLTVLL